MSEVQDIIREELAELLEMVHAEEKRIGRKLTMDEQNDLIIPFVEIHDKELIEHARQHLRERSEASG